MASADAQINFDHMRLISLHIPAGDHRLKVPERSKQSENESLAECLRDDIVFADFCWLSTLARTF